jgi:hypothetical protein
MANAAVQFLRPETIVKLAILTEVIAPWIDWEIGKPPKFRRSREIHAQRARKLRRRGEYVHFVRWSYGHCIYSWGGPIPDTFTVRMNPRIQSDTAAEPKR